jgi:hypothetical protein
VWAVFFFEESPAMPTTVWAPDPLPELDGRTGFVQVDDDDLAEQLLAADRVQNPAVGAFAMRGASAAPLDDAAPSSTESGTYATRELKAKNGPKRERPPKASE